MFSSAADGSQCKGIETPYGGDVNHNAAFLVIVLSHVLEGQEKSSDHSILEKSITMHCVRNFECDWCQSYCVFNVVNSRK